MTESKLGPILHWEPSTGTSLENVLSQWSCCCWVLSPCQSTCCVNQQARDSRSREHKHACARAHPTTYAPTSTEKPACIARTLRHACVSVRRKHRDTHSPFWPVGLHALPGELQEIYSAANINHREMEDHMESVVRFLHQQRYLLLNRTELSLLLGVIATYNSLSHLVLRIYLPNFFVSCCFPLSNAKVKTWGKRTIVSMCASVSKQEVACKYQKHQYSYLICRCKQQIHYY